MPPPAPQIGLQLFDLAAWTVGEHADLAHSVHDLAAWADDAGNFDPTSSEADVNLPHPPASQRVSAELMDRRLVVLPLYGFLEAGVDTSA